MNKFSSFLLVKLKMRYSKKKFKLKFLHGVLSVFKLWQGTILKLIKSNNLSKTLRRNYYIPRIAPVCRKKQWKNSTKMLWNFLYNQ